LFDRFGAPGKDTWPREDPEGQGYHHRNRRRDRSHGAVLYTSSAAALRGFNVIVPVDGMSAVGQNLYVEQYVAYNFTSAPIVSPKITLTSTDNIKF
jgi:hypothetical protein